MPDPKGGAREGAGRPSNADRYADKLTGFTDSAADYLPTVFDNLERLAECPERVETEYQAAGTIFRRSVARNPDGSIYLDAKGKTAVEFVCAFPELPPDQLVLVKRRTVSLPPDFHANELFIERIGGKARPMPEPDEKGLDLGEALDLADAELAGFVEPDPEVSDLTPGESPDAEPQE